MAGKRRFNLVLPEDMLAQLEQLAEEEGAPIVEVMRRFIKLGLYVTKAKKNPDTALIVRKDGRDQEILFL